MFYDRFVQLCAERGISPSRAAIEAGLSKSTVTKWKTTPDATPTGAAINKLSKYFGISIAELLGENEQKDPPTVSGVQNMSNLYNRIDALCKNRGISVTVMCKNAGVSRASLSDLKMGRNQNLSADTLSKIADFFSVTTDYLLGKETPLVNGDQELTDYLEMLKNRPECRMLFQLTKNATKEDVEAAVRIIEALRNK